MAAEAVQDRRSAARRPQVAPNARALTAAAMKLDPTDLREARRVKSYRQDWQRDAWGFYGTLPIVHYAHDYYGNVCSRVRLYAGFQSDPDDPPQPLDDIGPDDEKPEGANDGVSAAALDEMMRLDSSYDGGMAGMTADFAVNLSLVGEAFLIGQPDETSATGEKFAVYSTEELVASESGYKIHRKGSMQGEELPPDAYVLRVWRRLRQFRDLADAPMMALLDECDNLYTLTRKLKAISQSHIFAGILITPREWHFPQRTTDNNAAGQARDVPFIEQLNAAIVSAIRDPSSPSAVTPFHIDAPADTIKDARLLEFGRGEGVETLAQIQGVREGIAGGLDLPIEVITGHANTTFCADEATEVLTGEGWRSHDQIDVGTEVLTLDHVTGLAEWQRTTAVNRFAVEDEPVLRIDGKVHSSVTTAAHRWPVTLRNTGKRTWRTSGGKQRLNGNSAVPTAAPVRDLPTEAKWSDDLVELVAWFYTEGHVDRRNRRTGGMATISQSDEVNPENVARIRNALTRLVGAPIVKLHGTASVRVWAERRDRNRPIERFVFSRALTADLEVLAPDRVPTIEFIRSLTRAQLDLFLEVSVLGDGWTVNSGTVMFSQSDPRRVDGYELACILSGRTPSRWSAEAEGTGQLRGRRFTQHLCSVTNRTSVQPIRAGENEHPENVQWSTHTGTMWCPTTPNGTWLARRDGKVYFTGNSNAWQIAEETFKAHIEPLVQVICRSLTDGYLWPALTARGLDPTGYSVWYDPTALIGHADLFKNMAEMHTVYAVSDDALRRAGGANDDDAPEDAEIQKRLYIKQQERLTIRETGVAPAGEVQKDPNLDKGNAGTGAPTGTGATLPGPPVPTKAPPAKALAASGAIDRLAALGPHLTQIDQILTPRIQTLADAALHRVLERSGAMVARAIRGGKSTDLKAAIKNVASSEITQSLGQARVLALGLAEDKLIDAELGDLEPQYRKLTAKALRDALRAGKRAVPDGDLSDEQVDQHSRSQAEWIAAGFALLSTAILQTAHDQLFTPAQVPAGPGEVDLSARVSPSAIRESLAVAGGASDSSPVTGAPPGGVATGTIVMDAFREALQVLPMGWQWVYGYPDKEFPPHEALEGQEFSSWTDEILANQESWPDTDFYRPGDHLGCECQAMPMFESDRGEGDIPDEGE